MPDVVILVTNASDVHDLGLRGGLDRFGSDGMTRPPKSSRQEWLLARSHLARALLLTTGSQSHAALTLERITPAEIDGALRGIAGASAAIAELGRSEGFEFLLVTQPLLNDNQGPPGPGTLESLLPIAEALDVRAVDLRTRFAERLHGRDAAELFFPIDQHLNQEGYALLAEVVAEVLETAGLVRPAVIEAPDPSVLQFSRSTPDRRASRGRFGR